MAPDAENFRGVHAVRLLQDVEELTLDSLIELAYDPQLPGFEKLIPGLVEAWDEHADTWPALAEPIAILRNWDLRVSADSVAMTLAHFYGVQSCRSLPAVQCLPRRAGGRSRGAGRRHPRRGIAPCRQGLCANG